jgi:hypothetical protein
LPCDLHISFGRLQWPCLGVSPAGLDGGNGTAAIKTVILTFGGSDNCTTGDLSGTVVLYKAGLPEQRAWDAVVLYQKGRFRRTRANSQQV